MSGITSRVLQDISLSLPQKGIQLSSSRLHSTPSSRRFWSFFEFSRKENVPSNLEKIPVSTNSASPSLLAPRKGRNASEPIVSSTTPSMPSTVNLSAKQPCFSFTTKIPEKSASKLSKSYLKPDSLMSLLDDCVVPRNMNWKLKGYNTLCHENAGDFAFLPSAVNSQKLDILSELKYQSKSTREERQFQNSKSVNRTKQEMSLFGCWALEKSEKVLVRSETVTKFDVNKQSNRNQQLSTIKSTPNDLIHIQSQRPSRLPVRIPKVLRNFSKNTVNNIGKMREELLGEVMKINRRLPVSYQCNKKAGVVSEVPTTMRLQPHPRGSAASRSGTVGFGQPLSGNSGDGGSRKPPAFPRLPITSSESFNLMKGNGQSGRKKSATISIISKVNYSTKKSSCGNKEDIPPRKSKTKEECKRFCCPDLDEYECDFPDCSHDKTANDCKKPPIKRHSCSNSEKPPMKRSNHCQSSSDCNTQTSYTADYKYKVCCHDDCRDRVRNYQVCCPDERSVKRSNNKKNDPKCPPQPSQPREICTKPPPKDDCRPTKCPEPRDSCGNNNRRYSQLASVQSNSSSRRGTRHFSTISSLHSTSLARRLAEERIVLRMYASDPCNPSPPKKTDSCKPVVKEKEKDPCKPLAKPKEVDPCKPTAKVKQSIPCKPVNCDTKKTKPSAKCLPIDQVSVLKKEPSNSCSTSEKTPPKTSKSDEYCETKRPDPCKGAKVGEITSARVKKEKEETDACKSKVKTESKKDKDPCKPFSSVESKKHGTGLERVISPCKLEQLKKKAKKNGGSSCSKFAQASSIFSLPFHYFNPLKFSSDKSKDTDRLPPFMEGLFGEEEVQEAPMPIPIESDEEEE